MGYWFKLIVAERCRVGKIESCIKLHQADWGALSWWSHPLEISKLRRLGGPTAGTHTAFASPFQEVWDVSEVLHRKSWKSWLRWFVDSLSRSLMTQKLTNSHTGSLSESLSLHTRCSRWNLQSNSQIPNSPHAYCTFMKKYHRPAVFRRRKCTEATESLPCTVSGRVLEMVGWSKWWPWRMFACAKWSSYSGWVWPALWNERFSWGVLGARGQGYDSALTCFVIALGGSLWSSRPPRSTKVLL